MEESGEGRWVGDDECIDVEEGGVEVFKVSDSSLELLLVLERDEELELLEEDELEEDELEELEELKGLEELEVLVTPAIPSEVEELDEVLLGRDRVSLELVKASIELVEELNELEDKRKLSLELLEVAELEIDNQHIH